MSVIEHPCLILYRASTGLEKALVDVGGGRLILIDAEAVRSMWDPWTISPENLPTLAWAMQAQLWEDSWPDHTKREWIADQWLYQSLRGTRRGVEMALKVMGRDFTGGYDLLDVMTAPQGFYAAPDLTKEEWDHWIKQMPELRIQLVHRQGLADGEWYVVDAFVGDNHAGRNDGRVLYGRRVILRRPGQPDQDLGLVEWITVTEGRDTIDYEQVSIPGQAGAAFMVDEDFVTDARYVGAEEVAPQLYSFRLDGSYDHTTSLLHLTTLLPGLTPIDIQFERESDVGWADHFWHVNDFVDEYFADSGREDGTLLADRIFLYDPTVATPMTRGISFAGIDRVDYPPFNAELLIDLRTSEHGPAWIVDESAVEDSFAIPDDWADFDRAMRALKGPGASTSLRDKIMADFAICHPLRMREPLFADPQTRFGDQRPSWL